MKTQTITSLGRPGFSGVKEVKLGETLSPKEAEQFVSNDITPTKNFIYSVTAKVPGFHEAAGAAIAEAFAYVKLQYLFLKVLASANGIDTSLFIRTNYVGAQSRDTTGKAIAQKSSWYKLESSIKGAGVGASQERKLNPPKGTDFPVQTTVTAGLNPISYFEVVGFDFFVVAENFSASLATALPADHVVATVRYGASWTLKTINGAATFTHADSNDQVFITGPAAPQPPADIFRNFHSRPTKDLQPTPLGGLNNKQPLTFEAADFYPRPSVGTLYSVQPPLPYSQDTPAGSVVATLQYARPTPEGKVVFFASASDPAPTSICKIQVAHIRIGPATTFKPVEPVLSGVRLSVLQKGLRQHRPVRAGAPKDGAPRGGAAVPTKRPPPAAKAGGDRVANA